MRSNCTEWIKYMKDEVGKAGNLYTKQALKMRFTPYDEAKEKKKHSLKPEITIREALWIALNAADQIRRKRNREEQDKQSEMSL
jgi:hypothetical protein